MIDMRGTTTKETTTKTKDLIIKNIKQNRNGEKDKEGEEIIILMALGEEVEGDIKIITLMIRKNINLHLGSIC
jgi:hypothetical protein